jgi:hypothetical protein
MKEATVLLDPTAETAPAKRQRVTPPMSLDGLTIGLLDIGKARGDVFLDRLEEGMAARGLKVRRYAKPTNTKVAPVAVAQAIATECDVVVEALSD